MKSNGKKYIRHILFIFVGALLGYFLNAFVGCPTGTCAVTSNPFSP